MNLNLLIRRAMFLIAIFPMAVFGQSPSISGTVKDATGELLPGVTVLIEGTGKGAVSDFDGVYNLAFDEAGTYTISYNYIGFKKITESITLTAGQNMKRDVVMEEDALLLDAAVVVGYGTVKSKDL